MKVPINHGEDVPTSKLKEVDVNWIRNHFAKHRRKYRFYAEKYGVSLTCIGNIVRRNLWRHI